MDQEGKENGAARLSRREFLGRPVDAAKDIAQAIHTPDQEDTVVDPRLLEARMNRRGFTHAAVLATAWATSAGAWLSGKRNQKLQAPTTGSPRSADGAGSPRPADGAGSPRPAGEVSPKADEAGDIAPAMTTMTTEAKKQEAGTIEDFVFARYSVAEKQEAEVQIEAQKRHLKNTTNEQQLRQTLGWRDFVHKYSQYHKLSQAWEKLVLGLIFAESKGDPRQKNESSGAAGLGQLMPDTAAETAANLGLQEYDLFDPEQNIRMTIYHIKRLINLLKDPSLVIWAYHLGQGNLIEGAINPYLKQLGGGPLDIEDPDLAVKTRAQVDRFSLNATKLLRSPVVLQSLKQRKANQDHTEVYFYRAVAAAQLLSNYQTKA